MQRNNHIAHITCPLPLRAQLAHTQERKGGARTQKMQGGEDDEDDEDACRVCLHRLKSWNISEKEQIATWDLCFRSVAQIAKKRARITWDAMRHLLGLTRPFREAVPAFPATPHTPDGTPERVQLPTNQNHSLPLLSLSVPLGWQRVKIATGVEMPHICLCPILPVDFATKKILPQTLFFVFCALREGALRAW